MERVKVKDAALLLGVSQHFIRVGMQRGVLPIGSCVKTSSKWTYHISPKLLEDYTGKKIPTAATVGHSTTETTRES